MRGDHAKDQGVNITFNIEVDFEGITQRAWNAPL
jgi:hypothetical protein